MSARRRSQRSRRQGAARRGMRRPCWRAPRRTKHRRGRTPVGGGAAHTSGGGGRGTDQWRMRAVVMRQRGTWLCSYTLISRAQAHRMRIESLVRPPRQAGWEGSKRPLCDLNALSSTALPPHLVTECLGRGCPDVRFVQGFLQGHPRKGPMQIHQGHEQERGGAAREEPLCHGSGAGGNRDPRGVPLWNRLPVSRGVSADWLPERATGAGWASSCMVSAGLWLCCMN